MDHDPLGKDKLSREGGALIKEPLNRVGSRLGEGGRARVTGYIPPRANGPPPRRRRHPHTG